MQISYQLVIDALTVGDKKGLTKRLTFSVLRQPLCNRALHATDTNYTHVPVVVAVPVQCFTAIFTHLPAGRLFYPIDIYFYDSIANRPFPLVRQRGFSCDESILLIVYAMLSDNNRICVSKMRINNLQQFF